MARKTKNKTKEPKLTLEEQAEIEQTAEDQAIENGGEDEGERDLELELKKALAALKDASDQNLRLNADFINFRKRKEKEMSEVVRFANQDLISKLLPVLDNFERALDAMEKTDNLSAIKEGIEGVNKNMQTVLGKIGLEPIETLGSDFDSEFHEAITTIPVEEEEKKGTVIDEVEKGYKLKDRVIRFSKVIVGE